MKSLLFNHSKTASVLIAVILFFASCQKSEEIQTFDDVFDISGVVELNNKIAAANSLDDLSNVFEGIDFEIPETLASVDLNDVIDRLKSDIKLSSTEKSLLLKNDGDTYLSVINRFGSFALELEELGVDFVAISDAAREFTINIKQEPENFYSNDYCSAILAYQTFMEDHVITHLGNLNNLTGLKSASTPEEWYDDYPYELISLNDNWLMYWIYHDDGTRTKHKGAIADGE